MLFYFCAPIYSIFWQEDDDLHWYEQGTAIEQKFFSTMAILHFNSQIDSKTDFVEIHAW